MVHLHAEQLVLPFHVGHTLYRVYGLIRCAPEQLTLEFQTVENVLGLVRGRIRQIQIPWQELSEISLQPRRWGGANLRLSTLQLQTLRKFPGALQGTCRLQIRRADLALAEQWFHLLELHQAQWQLQQFDKPQPESPVTPGKLQQVQQIWEDVRSLLQKS